MPFLLGTSFVALTPLVSKHLCFLVQHKATSQAKQAVKWFYFFHGVIIHKAVLVVKHCVVGLCARQATDITTTYAPLQALASVFTFWLTARASRSRFLLFGAYAFAVEHRNNLPFSTGSGLHRVRACRYFRTAKTTCRYYDKPFSRLRERLHGF